MNTQDIDKLEAGPEMDALLATKVMEWQRPKNDTMEVWWAEGPNGDAIMMAFCDAWKPSKNISAAFVVLSAMSVKKFRWYLSGPGEKQPATHFTDQCYCLIQPEPHKPWQADFRAYADTVPLAIGRAALKAIMGQNYER